MRNWSSLDASSATVAGDFSLDHAKSLGNVKFDDAAIGGSLDCSSADSGSNHEGTLDFSVSPTVRVIECHRLLQRDPGGVAPLPQVTDAPGR
jgi:hypothetical protein